MRFLLILIMLCSCLSVPAFAAEEPRLQRISKQEDPLETRVLLDFSTLPSHRLKISGQRIDLFLAGAASDAGLNELPEGGSVIKILLGARNKELMVSFLLAHAPKDVRLERDDNRQQMALVVAWGRTPTVARPVIASSLPAPRPSSRFSGRWQEFFRDYPLPLEIPLSLRPSLVGVPYLKYHPLGNDTDATLLREAIGLSSQGEWAQALTTFSRVNPAALQGPDLEAQLLFLAEALVRNGRFTTAKPLLTDYLARYPDSPLVMRGRFLLCVVLANGDDPYRAAARLDEFALASGGWPASYQGPLSLLQAELDLLTGRPAQALQRLDRLPVQAAALEARRQLRRADALAASGRSAEALALYRRWAEQPALWLEQPASLGRFAEALYAGGDWLGSADRYGQLAGQLLGDPLQPLASFGAARGFLRAEDLTQGLPLFAVSQAEPVTSEAGWRARMLELDRGQWTDEGPKGVAAAERYAALVKHAPNRTLAEVAAFKRLLSLALNGLPQLCVDELPGFFRRYGSGSLRGEGEALLVELLPGVLEDLLARGEDLPALVLVEQHREFLVGGGVSAPFLLRLGEVFERVGLLEKAQKVYSYLFEGMAGRSEQASFYLPLARVQRDRRQPNLAIDLIDRYLAAYPKGEDRTALLVMKGEILYGQGKLEEAVKVLTSVQGLASEPMELLAKIYWELGRLPEAERAFARFGGAESGPKRIQALALQAESLYRQQKGEEALSLYQELAADGAFADQALYRIAQIHLAAGRRAQALKFLQRLVDEGRSPRWQQLAKELLELQSLTGR